MIWTHLILAYFSLFALGIIDNGRGPIYPFIINFFHLTKFEASLFFSLASLSSLVANITAPFWINKKSSLYWMRVFLLVLGLAPIQLGFSSIYFSGLGVIIFNSLVLGLGLGGIGLVMNILAAQSSTIEYRKRAFSGLHSMYGISSFLSPFLFNLFLEKGADWRWFSVSTGILPILGFFLSFLITEKKLEISSDKKDFQLSFKKCMPFVMLFSFYVSSEILLSSRLVILLVEEFGLATKLANNYLSGFFFFLFSGRILFSFLSIKVSNKLMLYLSTATTFCLFVIGEWFRLPIAFSLCGLSMSYFFPFGMDWVTCEFGEKSGIVVGWIMTGIGISLFLVHGFFGFLSDSFGVSKAFYIEYILFAFVFVFIYQLKEKKGK
ncbi:MAG: MFS transporter [Bacteriovoracaceae bacterium]|jgi:MFS transporter, FHS family, glucose/mannose:H+ symporter|nr:MFS transporter [Bacteriovoracaceae bacterium]